MYHCLKCAIIRPIWPEVTDATKDQHGSSAAIGSEHYKLTLMCIIYSFHFFLDLTLHQQGQAGRKVRR